MVIDWPTLHVFVYCYLYLCPAVGEISEIPLEPETDMFTRRMADWQLQGCVSSQKFQKGTTKWPVVVFFSPL